MSPDVTNTFESIFNSIPQFPGDSKWVEFCDQLDLDEGEEDRNN